MKTIDTSGQVLETVNRYRLTQDRSYRALAKEISETCESGRGITYGALHALLSGQKKPTDRTIFKLKRFLEKRLRPCMQGAAR